MKTWPFGVKSSGWSCKPSQQLLAKRQRACWVFGRFWSYFFVMKNPATLKCFEEKSQALTHSHHLYQKPTNAANLHGSLIHIFSSLPRLCWLRRWPLDIRLISNVWWLSTQTQVEGLERRKLQHALWFRLFDSHLPFKKWVELSTFHLPKRPLLWSHDQWKPHSETCSSEAPVCDVFELRPNKTRECEDKACEWAHSFFKLQTLKLFQQSVKKVLIPNE